MVYSSARILQVFILELFFTSVATLGVFEIRIHDFENRRGELKNGSCCFGQARGSTSNGGTVCVSDCRTYFSACLKEHQAKIRTNSPCTFGNATTEVLGGNGFQYSKKSSRAILQIPFNFAWTVSFSLILSAQNADPDVIPIEQTSSISGLIDQATYSGAVTPDSKWRRLVFTSTRVRLSYDIRVKCRENYFNRTCMRYCRPRDDKWGHYHCDVHGDRICIPGWRGINCDQLGQASICHLRTKPGTQADIVYIFFGAICKQGCSDLHGSCEFPGDCRCDYGWEGPLCDQCIKYPQCKHGTCDGSPFTCKCDINWGGQFCDRDMNYCDRHKPCLNDGICHHTWDLLQYRCECPAGYTGTDCEIKHSPCDSNPCLNEGTCVNVQSTSICNCRPGYAGLRCEQDINECASNPCQHGGTCHDGINSFRCDCPSGWRGPQCQLDADECFGSPCVNALGCRNLIGDYTCDCIPGWTGKKCDVNMNDCAANICKNGGTCLDKVNGYECRCFPGFSGGQCEIDIDECLSDPCRNGGVCEDQRGGFKCHCPAGYKGSLCQIDSDHCDPNLCEHGSDCFNLEDDYFCRCHGEWQGKNCHVPKMQCQSCKVLDSCGVLVRQPNSSSLKVEPWGICGSHGTCISQPGTGNFTCKCDHGYTGTYCNLNENDCDENACLNGGTCIDKLGAFECICPTGWEGPRCQLETEDCTPTSCLNNGTCVERVGDFFCQCGNGWKGKSCHLDKSHCDETTCFNGGTCIDLRSTFTCHCPPEWTGDTCNILKKRACDKNPCRNGATCVNVGQSFVCLCQEGWESALCDKDINDCASSPCYNNATCVDGVNIHWCKCRQGFAGPDCRINIDECESSPCTYGSTCIDLIAGYNCICPTNRHGSRCEKVVGYGQSCYYNNRMYTDGSTWRAGCDRCVCQKGHVTCTQKECTPRSCGYHPNTTGGDWSISLFETDSAPLCPNGETCILEEILDCFTPPCSPRGRCLKLPIVAAVKTPNLKDVQVYEHCDASPTTRLHRRCSRITLTYNRQLLPAGVKVSTICNKLRELSSAYNMVAYPLLILCKQDSSSPNVIVVTLSPEHYWPSPEAKVLGVEPQVTEPTIKLSRIVSREIKHSPLFAAVIQIRVETAADIDPLVISSKQSEDDAIPSYLIPVVCSIIGVLGIFVLLCLLAWHHRRMTAINMTRLQTIDRMTNLNNEIRQNQQRLSRIPNSISCPGVDAIELSQMRQELEKQQNKLKNTDATSVLGSRAFLVQGDQLQINNLNPANSNYRIESFSYGQSCSSFRDDIPHSRFSSPAHAANALEMPKINNIDQQKSLQYQCADPNSFFV